MSPAVVNYINYINTQRTQLEIKIFELQAELDQLKSDRAGQGQTESPK